MAKIFYIVFVLSFQSCVVARYKQVNNFTTKPSKVENGIVRLVKINDGAFIRNIGEINGFQHFDAIFFYSNGVSLSYYLKIPVGQKEQSFSELIEQEIQNEINLEKKYHNGKKTAGGYLLKSSGEIKIQLFQQGHYGIYELAEYNGVVLNESEIKIHSLTIGMTNENFADKIDFIYHFFKMSKPDSTNQLMNKTWYWENK